jgi:cytochrome b subunit of formate dehydrogenase
MILTFVFVSVFCLIALFFLLSYHRFQQSPEDRYFPWLQSRMPIFVKTPWIERSKEIYRSWFIQRYPANQRWIFLGLAFSYCYLILSGFLFVFIRVRLFGSFLLLHVVLGALFAVCLCLAVVLRARLYVWNVEDLAPANLKTKAGKRKMWQIVLFWIFVASGLVLVITALFQMLPHFSLRAQLIVFEVHRYAALEIFLAGIAFLYFSLVDDSQ